MFLTEDHIRKRVYDALLSTAPEALLVEKWSGYTVKTGSERQREFLVREMDLAMFTLQAQPELTQLLVLGGLKHRIVLTTYEVKGHTRTKEGKWSEPAFGDGLDQAVVHLYQGADNSWLVYPDIGSEKGTKLADICSNFCPRVGVLFVTKSGSFLPYKAPVEGPITGQNEQTKRKMLARLITSGTYSRINEPDWAKKHLY